MIILRGELNHSIQYICNSSNDCMVAFHPNASFCVYLVLLVTSTSLGVELLSSMEIFFFFREEIAKLFSEVGCTILHSFQPGTIQGGGLFNFSYCSMYVVVSHCDLNLCFPNDEWPWNLFMCLFTVYVFGKASVQTFSSF